MTKEERKIGGGIHALRRGSGLSSVKDLPLREGEKGAPWVGGGSIDVREGRRKDTLTAKRMEFSVGHRFENLGASMTYQQSYRYRLKSRWCKNEQGFRGKNKEKGTY